MLLYLAKDPKIVCKTGNPEDPSDRRTGRRRSARYPSVRLWLLLAAWAWAACSATPGMAQSGAAPTANQMSPTAGTDESRDARGEIDNAVLMLHWTAADGSALLTPEFMKALYGPGRPLDAHRYFLVFLDNVGHGRLSKPSDGLKTEFPADGYGDMPSWLEPKRTAIEHRLRSKSPTPVGTWAAPKR